MARVAALGKRSPGNKRSCLLVPDLRRGTPVAHCRRGEQLFIVGSKIGKYNAALEFSTNSGDSVDHGIQCRNHAHSDT